MTQVDASTQTTTRSTGSSVARIKNSPSHPPTQKSVDFTISGIYKGGPVHVSGFILASGKVSIRTDMSPKRTIVSKEDVVSWTKRKKLELFKRKHSEVVIGDNVVSLPIGDIEKLIKQINSHLEK
jgi:hypothetical protein